MTSCSDCGSWGHRAKSPRCPYRETLKRQNRFNLELPRPELKELVPFDPALREATLRTIFLPGSS